MNSVDSLERFLQVEVAQWRRRDKGPGVQVGPVIAVSREPGCGGEQIAERLALELGLVLYGWQIVDQIAKNAHVSDQVVSTLDEKTRSDLQDWLAGFREDHNLSMYTYLQCLRKVVFVIAAHGSAVILGRGGNFLLPPEKRLGLRLIAPVEVRIRNTMAELNCPEEQAREHISKIERERRSFVKKYFLADIASPIHYHLVINTAWVRPETIVDIVKGIVKPTAVC